MNSRERLISSINHKQPDRIPVDLGGSTVSGISALAYSALLKKLGINKPVLVFDTVQQLAHVDDEILELFGADCLDVNRIFTREEKAWYDIELAGGEIVKYPGWFRPLQDDDGGLYTVDQEKRVISRMPSGASSFDQTIFPWQDGLPDDFSSLKNAFKSINWFVHSHNNYINISDSELRSKVQDIRENSDRAIVMSGGVKLLETGFFLRRMDNLFMDLMLEQDKLGKLFDALTEMHLAGLEKKCRAVGDLVDVIRFGDDLGMSSGPFMDLDTFRKLLKPRYKILCDFVKKNSNMKIFLHSCGSIRQFIPDLIEVGFDIINPVQTNCEGMDPLSLKNDFGKDITFWGGGVDTASILNMGKPEDVRKDVLKRCEILSRDGGFIFAPIHNILSEVPPENIIAAYSAVKEFNGI